ACNNLLISGGSVFVDLRDTSWTFVFRFRLSLSPWRRRAPTAARARRRGRLRWALLHPSYAPLLRSGRPVQASSPTSAYAPAPPISRSENASGRWRRFAEDA